VTCSVPQGSVLGSLLFILLAYTADLADLASKLGVKLHAFADDIQLLVHCEHIAEITEIAICDLSNLSNVLSSLNALEQCAIAIGHWMSANNAEKTKLMWAGTTRYTVASFLRLHDRTLALGSSTVNAAYAVRVLGVLLHRTLHSRSMYNDSQCQMFFFSTASTASGETFTRSSRA